MEIFSSADRTNSASLSRGPPKTRSYRSRMREALAAKSGSRGKIQQRCCHGRIASSESQRQTVLSLILATSPAGGNRIVVQSFGHKQDHPGSEYVIIR